MSSSSLKRLFNRLFEVVLGGFLLVLMGASAQDKAKPDVNGIPKKVMDSLKARFPNPEIRKWTKEEENGAVLYDIEFMQRGNKLEADIKQDGTIDNWEKEIPVKDLPAAVRMAVDSRYPNSVVKEFMAITVVKNGKEAPEGYEITLEAAGKKAVELTVAPDGKVLEDSEARK